jgi:hypothetical protein
MRKTQTIAIAARGSHHETSEFSLLATVLISIERGVLLAAPPPSSLDKDLSHRQIGSRFTNLGRPSLHRQIVKSAPSSPLPPDDTEGTRGRRLFTTFGNRQCARVSSHIFRQLCRMPSHANAYWLEYGGRSSPAFRGGETGHLLRRLFIATSFSVGGSEAS